jgi:hypothetical protein
MSKIIADRKVKRSNGIIVRVHYYWCPGCGTLHGMTIKPDVNPYTGAGWEFSGTLENPTYSPSQLTQWEGTVDGKPHKQVCHTFIRNGQIEFLSDCTHAMKGKTVPLPPIPDWVFRDD